MLFVPSVPSGRRVAEGMLEVSAPHVFIGIQSCEVSMLIVFSDARVVEVRVLRRESVLEVKQRSASAAMMFRRDGFACACLCGIVWFMLLVRALA